MKFKIKTQVERDLGVSVLNGAISTIKSDANKEFIDLLKKNLKDRLSKQNANKEDLILMLKLKCLQLSIY
ncbi:MAG: hypothetical protein ACR5KV_02650 [Wolbachia sp.]